MVDKGQHFRVCQIQEMQLLFYRLMKIDDVLLIHIRCFLPPSLMIWINTGPGDRGTIEKSWMDASERSSLAVITAQSAHSLTADVAARRLYWISDFKRVRFGSIVHHRWGLLHRNHFYLLLYSSVTPGHVLILFIINKCKCHPCGIHLKSKSIYFTPFKVNNNQKKFVCVPYFFFLFFSHHMPLFFLPQQSIFIRKLSDTFLSVLHM